MRRLPAIDVPLDEAQGLVLASDVIAPHPVPTFANSAMDGYAVRVADVADPPVVLEISEDVPAGRVASGPVRPRRRHQDLDRSAHSRWRRSSGESRGHRADSGRKGEDHVLGGDGRRGEARGRRPDRGAVGDARRCPTGSRSPGSPGHHRGLGAEGEKKSQGGGALHRG